MSQIHVQWSHFLGLVVIVDFYDVSIQKYVVPSFTLKMKILPLIFLPK